MKSRKFICTADNKYITRFIKRPDGTHWEFCGRDQADLFLEEEADAVAIACLGPGARYRLQDPTWKEFQSWSGRHAGRVRSAKKTWHCRRNGKTPKRRKPNDPIQPPTQT